MKASVIISVYKDAEALACILNGLRRQTVRDFEVIVAEDGEDPFVKAVCDEVDDLGLEHQTQEDIGFRKTRAVNRAILAARHPYLAFLDGDCVPHSEWLATHIAHASCGTILAARRLHLGRRFSERLRKEAKFVAKLEALRYAPFLLPCLQLDGARNIELARPSRLMQRIFGRKTINLVGCNFSGYKNDLMLVNGYDESLPGIGGEDDDLHWRLEGMGLCVKNLKFEAIVYHLFHESRRVDFEVNRRISQRSLQARQYFASNGIVKLPQVL